MPACHSKSIASRYHVGQRGRTASAATSINRRAERMASCRWIMTLELDLEVPFRRLACRAQWFLTETIEGEPHYLLMVMLPPSEDLRRGRFDTRAK